mmetsp:Transcript_472/g.1030  ORF Transcript_472/g.1030 Transcript_472/m.1030 type:complete len:98 (+) Transcript_472:1109-1402(+)
MKFFVHSTHDHVCCNYFVADLEMHHERMKLLMKHRETQPQSAADAGKKDLLRVSTLLEGMVSVASLLWSRLVAFKFLNHKEPLDNSCFVANDVNCEV